MGLQVFAVKSFQSIHLKSSVQKYGRQKEWRALVNLACWLGENCCCIFSCHPIFSKNLICQTFDIQLKDHDYYTSPIARKQKHKCWGTEH